MIKVIEHGVKKVTCPYCRAKLEYELEDIQEDVHPVILGEVETYNFIVCPDCGNEITLTL